MHLASLLKIFVAITLLGSVKLIDGGSLCSAPSIIYSLLQSGSTDVLNALNIFYNTVPIIPVPGLNNGQATFGLIKYLCNITLIIGKSCGASVVPAAASAPNINTYPLYQTMCVIDTTSTTSFFYNTFKCSNASALLNLAAQTCATFANCMIDSLGTFSPTCFMNSLPTTTVLPSTSTTATKPMTSTTKPATTTTKPMTTATKPMTTSTKPATKTTKPMTTTIMTTKPATTTTKPATMTTKPMTTATKPMTTATKPATTTTKPMTTTTKPGTTTIKPATTTTKPATTTTKPLTTTAPFAGSSCSVSQILFPLLQNSTSIAAKAVLAFFAGVQNYSSSTAMANANAALGSIQTLCNMIAMVNWGQCNPMIIPSSFIPVDSIYTSKCGSLYIPYAFNYLATFANSCQNNSIVMGQVNQAYTTCQSFISKNCLMGPIFNAACFQTISG